ncbi:hypothetical protein EVAR_95748_1 [Eumeta japonica]|uniref:Uncharacterized protein n=1 Tax=Eumeta variegata TaxID=151549 RepID=A0A4C1ULV8_EUMVA|nr:hypothetical protein EVAR_95748_1 [Eumeta japonica]
MQRCTGARRDATGKRSPSWETNHIRGVAHAVAGAVLSTSPVLWAAPAPPARDVFTQSSPGRGRTWPAYVLTSGIFARGVHRSGITFIPRSTSEDWGGVINAETVLRLCLIRSKSVLNSANRSHRPIKRNNRVRLRRGRRKKKEKKTPARRVGVSQAIRMQIETRKPLRRASIELDLLASALFDEDSFSLSTSCAHGRVTSSHCRGIPLPESTCFRTKAMDLEDVTPARCGPGAVNERCRF